MTASYRLSIPKTIALLIFIAAAFFFLNPVFAQDATSSTKGLEKIEARKANTLQRIDTKKQNAENRMTAIREKIASKEAALKERLQMFKDKKKAEIAERVNTNLNKINQNQTDQMQKHLDKMTSLLNRLEDRVTSKEGIADARVAIASASSAILTQAEKDYTLQVTTENQIRTAAQAMRDQLHKDLQAARAQVIDAKQSVANAIRVAKSGKLEAPKEGTSSAE